MLKIRFALFASMLFISFVIKAQNAVKIDIGAEFGLPSRNFAAISNIGLGGSVKAEFPIASSFALTLNGGITNFFGKRNQLLNVQDLTYAPLKAGLKYYLSGTFYVEGQLGATLALSNGQKTLFAWSPGLGNIFNLAGKNKLDLGIRYEGWTGKNESMTFLNTSSTKGFLGVRFAYVFAL